MGFLVAACTQAPCIRSAESYPLDHQRSPSWPSLSGVVCSCSYRLAGVLYRFLMSLLSVMWLQRASTSLICHFTLSKFFLQFHIFKNMDALFFHDSLLERWSFPHCSQCHHKSSDCICGFDPGFSFLFHWPVCLLATMILGTVVH